jgi:hypothetical protein
MKRGVEKGMVRLVAVFCASILLFSTPASAAPAFDAPGDGTSAHPYLVTTCQQLQDMNSLLTAHYKLMRHIDCSSFGTFSSVGNYFENAPFTGEFDGNRYSVIGLKTGTGGMFGYINGATIKNVQLKDSTYTIATGIYAGTLADVAMNSTFTNVHSSVVVNGSSPQMGGLVGDAIHSSFDKSSFTGAVGTTSEIVGGIAAMFEGNGSITDSYVRATLAGGQQVGGLVGLNQGPGAQTITRSYSASMLGYATSTVGGLIGEAGFGFSTPIALSDSFSASTFNGSGQYLGGIVGQVAHFSSTPTGTTYYDDTLAVGESGCSGNTPSTPLSCTAVNVGNAEPGYFKDNSTNPPLNNWSFGPNDAWQTRTNDYPELRGKAALRENTFTDMNNDGINDLMQGTVNSATDFNGKDATFVIGSDAQCINDNSMFHQFSLTLGDPVDTGYTLQSPMYWSTDIYCRDAGTAIPVTIIFDKVYDTSGSVLRHYQPASKTYSTISNATFSTVTVGGVPKTAATYTIVEGGSLDPDDTANGFIVDPVALVSAPPAGVGGGNGNASVIPGVPNTDFVGSQVTQIPEAYVQQSRLSPLLATIGLFAAVGVIGYALRFAKKRLKL